MLSIAFNLVFFALDLFKWAIILAAVFSLLAGFGVLDLRNRTVWSIGDFLNRITEPVLRPIRNVLPNLGNIDISPIIALALIQLAIIPLLGRLQSALLTGNWQGLFF